MKLIGLPDLWVPVPEQLLAFTTAGPPTDPMLLPVMEQRVDAWADPVLAAAVSSLTPFSCSICSHGPFLFVAVPDAVFKAGLGFNGVPRAVLARTQACFLSSDPAQRPHSQSDEQRATLSHFFILYCFFPFLSSKYLGLRTYPSRWKTVLGRLLPLLGPGCCSVVGVASSSSIVARCRPLALRYPLYCLLSPLFLFKFLFSSSFLTTECSRPGP
jgi:hypothetical protein